MNIGGTQAVHNRCCMLCDQSYISLILIRRIRRRGQHIPVQGNDVPKDQTGGAGEAEPSFSYALVFPRFRPRPSSVSSCESGIWPGAGISKSFPCAAIFCTNVSHMTSFIPLARASCVFNRA